jgi:hypothetical protein
VGGAPPRARIVVLAVAAVGCTVGCAADPPEPPAVGALSYRMNAIEGEPGAVEPPEGRVWLIDPFAGGAPVTLPVMDDGSFGPISWTTLEDTTRLEVRVDGARSVPIDVVRGPDNTAQLRPLVRDCATAAPDLDFGEVESGTPITLDVVVDNACAEDLVLSAERTSLRFGDRGFAIDAVDPPESPVPTGGALSVPVTFTPGAGFAEDVLTLDLRTGGGEDDRRFVTLVGNGV